MDNTENQGGAEVAAEASAETAAAPTVAVKRVKISTVVSMPADADETLAQSAILTPEAYSNLPEGMAWEEGSEEVETLPAEAE